MAAQLLVTAGPDVGRVFPLAAGTPLVIGRGAASQTKLADAHVSRVHCEVIWDGRQGLVKDSGSAAGTAINGRRVTAAARLKVGDKLRVGETELQLVTDVAEEKTLPPAGEVVLANRPGQRRLPPALKQLQDLAGSMLGGFHLLSVVGAGQIGVVFRARDTKDQKIVALKVLHADFLQDAKAVQRFIRGLKTARSLDHPNLVALHNAGIAKPYCWISMEFIDGNSLAERISGGKLDCTQAIRLAIHMARALEYLHKQNVLHRNVIPPNILIQKKDQVAKLGDALLAKSLLAADWDNLTGTGELVGNMFYLAPERTVPEAPVDARADLYMLGATLYHAVTGRLPFQAKSLPELVTQIRQAAPDRPQRFQPDLPVAFEAILLRLLAKKADQRHESAKELLSELEKVAAAGGFESDNGLLPGPDV